MSTISTILAKEIEHEEKEGHQQMDEELMALNKQITAEWAQSEESGKALVTLVKETGGETITIEFDCDASSEDEDVEDDEDVEEDEDEAPPDTTRRFTLTIAKGEKKLYFNCVAADGVVIDSLAHYGPGEGPEDESLYHGPAYEELDEELQDAVDEYLVERGIDTNVTDYITRFAEYKEQTEYFGWLNKVRSFVE